MPLGLTAAVLALVDVLGASGVLGGFAAGLTISSLITTEERQAMEQAQAAARSSL